MKFLKKNEFTNDYETVIHNDQDEELKVTLSKKYGSTEDHTITLETEQENGDKLGRITLTLPEFEILAQMIVRYEASVKAMEGDD